MSVFTTISPQVRDVQAHKSACAGRSLAVADHAMAPGFSRNTHRGDLVIGTGARVGFHPMAGDPSCA